LKEENRLSMFTAVLRKVFGPESDITRDSRRLREEEPTICTAYRIFQDVRIKQSKFYGEGG
jgi:hypothetical protein